MHSAGPMPRSIWTGAISFGLVNVPVKLYSAVEHKEVRFHLLHVRDGGRIREKRVCSKNGQEVPWEEVAKGFPIGKHRYVMLTKEELEALDPKATRTIDIQDFVALDEIDPIYYESTYYVGPADEAASRAYALLLVAMQRQKKVAIARMVMRMRQYLCALRPMGQVLALHTMFYADEIRPADRVDLVPVTAKPSQRELELAEQLVGALTTAFEPGRYHDEYRERVLSLIEQKAAGREITVPEVAPAAEAEVISLADALAASLRRRRAAGAAPEPARAPRPRRGERVRRAAASKGVVPPPPTSSETTRPRRSLRSRS